MPITALDQVTDYPLCWPEAKPRCAHREASRFKQTLAKALQEIEWEMARWGVGDRWVCSRAPAYRRSTGDPGVALWFEMPRRAGQSVRELRVIACDQYLVQDHNVWAVYCTLDALRAVERWGAYSLEQAVEGARPMLPPPAGMGPKKWWEVLRVPSNWPLDAIEMKYQMLAKSAHPDNGGSDDAMAELNAAISEARKQVTA